MSEEIKTFIRNALNLKESEEIPQDLSQQINEINSIMACGNTAWDRYTPPELLPQIRSTQMVAMIIYNWKQSKI